MIWVFVFGGIALAGLIMLIAYAVWLAHKTADVLSEVRVLLDRTDQFFTLVGQIQPPERTRDIAPRETDLTSSGSVSEYPAN